MQNLQITYHANDLALIVPTKDRPQKIKNLLKSIENQDVKVGRVIIVAFGQNIGNVVDAFKPALPIEYYHVEEGGQIKQRNFGISLLRSENTLVGFLDDDIVLQPLALKRMLNFWNSQEIKPAGVGFNIINEEAHKYSFFRSLFCASARSPGVVLKSGKSTPITNVRENLQTGWLNGGATIWRQEIIKKYQHKEVKSRWAIFEDVIYSYPIGKKYPLHISADAEVRHEHERDHGNNGKHYFYGRNKVLWNYYFVSRFDDLSKLAFFWSTIGGIAFKTMTVFGLNKITFQETIGEIRGFFAIFKASFKGISIEEVIRNS